MDIDMNLKNTFLSLEPDSTLDVVIIYCIIIGWWAILSVCSIIALMIAIKLIFL